MLEVRSSFWNSSEMRFCGEQEYTKRPCHQKFVRRISRTEKEVSEIEKVDMEEGRRSRQQLLRERESLSFCLQNQTSFCNRKFSTAASRNETTADDDNDDDDVSWLK